MSKKLKYTLNNHNLFNLGTMKNGYSLVYKAWFLFSAFIIISLIWSYINIHNKHDIQYETEEITSSNRYDQMCKILNISDTLFNYQNFYVNYNMTILQPNYIYYLKNKHNFNITKEIWYVKNDHSITNLDINDYFEAFLQYYRIIRLAPESEFGNSSYTIVNSVILPENEFLNWSYLDQYLDRYIGKLIYKGCDYDLQNYVTSGNHKLYTPLGCYYVVLNHQELNPIGELVDYGYFTNTKIEKKLPYWITCYNQDENLNGTIILDKPGQYIIDKYDYKFANNLTIEILSSGGGFAMDREKIITGSSGEYLKFNTIPKNTSFNITIGKGGLDGLNGEPISIDGHFVNIILKGGQSGSKLNELNRFDGINNYIYYPQNSGITKYTTNIKEIKDSDPPVDLPYGYGAGIGNNSTNYNGIVIINY